MLAWQAYKYVIFENGQFLRWEEMDVPRVIFAESCSVEVRAYAVRGDEQTRGLW